MKPNLEAAPHETAAEPDPLPLDPRTMPPPVPAKLDRPRPPTPPLPLASTEDMIKAMTATTRNILEKFLARSFFMFKYIQEKTERFTLFLPFIFGETEEENRNLTYLWEIRRMKKGEGIIRRRGRRRWRPWKRMTGKFGDSCWERRRRVTVSTTKYTNLL